MTSAPCGKGPSVYLGAVFPAVRSLSTPRALAKAGYLILPVRDSNALLHQISTTERELNPPASCQRDE